MTKREFLEVMALMEAAIRKEATQKTSDAYFELLGDLPADALRLAAKKVLLEHPWNTFPSVAELRQAAVETMRGQVSELSPAEAWEIAWKVVANTDLEVQGSFDRASKNAPPLVVAAMKAFGLSSLVYGKESVSVVRAQFLKVYEQLANRERRQALLPTPMKRAIAEIGLMPEQRKLLTKG